MAEETYYQIYFQDTKTVVGSLMMRYPPKERDKVKVILREMIEIIEDKHPGREIKYKEIGRYSYKKLPKLEGILIEGKTK